jgi:cob(I)alamin adenosyltransferase
MIKMPEPKKDGKNELGYIHVYTGDGKGKTSVALGSALRAVGHGFRVCIIQFSKGGRYYGELRAAEKYLQGKRKRGRLDFAQFGQGCPYADKIAAGKLKCGGCRACFLPFEEEKEQARKAMVYSEKIIKSGNYDLIVLDEINVAMNKKHLDAEDVLKLMLSKPKKTELILTGRGAPAHVIDAADYATEMKKIKHPFDLKRKTYARRGVEY